MSSPCAAIVPADASLRAPTPGELPGVKVSLLYGKRAILQSRVGHGAGPLVTAPPVTPPGSGTPPWPSIPAMVDQAAARDAERVAIRDGSTVRTYAELATAAKEFAAALVVAVVEPGDRVAIWCGNCAEWTVAALGLFAAGAVLVPVNTRFKGNEAAVVLSRSGARVLVTVTDFLGTDYVAMLEGSGTPLPDLQTLVVARGDATG